MTERSSLSFSRYIRGRESEGLFLPVPLLGPQRREKARDSFRAVSGPRPESREFLVVAVSFCVF